MELKTQGIMSKTISDDDCSEHGSCSDSRSADANNCDIVYDDEHDGEDNSEERLAKSRERNREHARRTRLRKKSQLQELQHKIKDLEAERKVLKQSVEECSIASILLNLSGNGLDKAQSEGLSQALSSQESTTNGQPPKKRKRSASESSDLVITINGKQTTIRGNGKTHVNWKTGIYTNEDGAQITLTVEELEALRRERNRRHAKMTRDRKKMFLSSIKDSIAKMEEENNRMRFVLACHSPTLSAVVCSSAGVSD